MLICQFCGALCSEDELNVKTDESTGYRWNTCYRCNLDNSFVDAVKCDECGDWIDPDSAYGYDAKLCEDCLIHKHNNIDDCYKVGAEETENVEINGFIARMYSKQEIEELCLRDLRKSDVDCSEYIKSEMNLFADIIKEDLK